MYDGSGDQKEHHDHSTWGPQRATNHLDQVPSMQDGSESFYFRHGHQGLLTLQLQAPMPLSTTQKDSYQPPGNHCQPMRGVKHEGMGQNESSSQGGKERKEFVVGLWIVQWVQGQNPMIFLPFLNFVSSGPAS